MADHQRPKPEPGLPHYLLGDHEEALRDVEASPGFRAFCALVGLRVREGRSLVAFRMLELLELPPAVVHQLLEAWPLVPLDRPPTLIERACPIPLQAALRVALTLGREVGAYDWPGLMRGARAILAAEE